MDLATSRRAQPSDVRDILSRCVQIDKTNRSVSHLGGADAEMSRRIPRIARLRSSGGRSVRVLVLVAGAGLALGLTGCGSSRPVEAVSAGLGPGGYLTGVQLRHRPAGRRIGIRLDEGLWDRAGLSECT